MKDIHYGLIERGLMKPALLVREDVPMSAINSQVITSLPKEKGLEALGY